MTSSPHFTPPRRRYSYTGPVEDQESALRLPLCLTEQTLGFKLTWNTAKMPSTKKILLFLSSALVTAISVGLLGFAMSAQWADTTMVCEASEGGNVTGTAVVKMSLFKGVLTKVSCPLGGEDRFDVFPTLTLIGVSPLAVHGLLVSLLALCLLFSAGSILISLYNSVSNPYETYMGPIGVYTCSSLSACLSVLVLIIFALNLGVTSMPEDLVNQVSNIKVDVRNKSLQMQLGYFLVIPYTVMSLCAVLLIYLYDHASYTQRRQQERPTEDAPKEIMMY
ncbi:clarin-3 [Nothobranchius furzeri]|uniref:Clarin 3 n=4 Tax=Nothobranchius TaxID=28779 RepID=A0A8C6PQC6_NOTFU|nr:clarin-3 [Nothobranchius furzeri]KAF7204179.1 clarin-3-like [Nothobranchius furzeri]